MLLYSCGPSPLFEKTFEIDNQIWSYEDGKLFSFEAIDTINTYDLILDLVHSENYSFENLYIQLLTRFPDLENVTDEISIPLIKDDGHWVGKGSADKRVRVYLQQSLRFQQLGEHTILLKQHSREEQLKGVSSLRLAIYPHLQ